VRYPIVTGIEIYLRYWIPILPDPPLIDEVSVFAAATEESTRANLNCTIGESMEKLSYPILDEGGQGLASVELNALHPHIEYRVYLLKRDMHELKCKQLSEEVPKSSNESPTNAKQQRR
jgi:hypothetical protein